MATVFLNIINNFYNYFLGEVALGCPLKRERSIDISTIIT